MSTTDKLINVLLQEIAKPQGSASTTLTAPPSPIFISKMSTPHSPKTSQMHTPPRSPGGDKYLGRTFSPKVSGSMFDIKPSGNSSLHDSDPDFQLSKQGSGSKGPDSTHDNSADYPIVQQWSKTDGAAMAKVFK